MRFTTVALAGALALTTGNALAARNFGLYPVRQGGAAPVAPIANPFATAEQCGVATYCGGPVIANVQIQPVFWTSVSSSITSFAPGYLKTIADSVFMDMLSEYSTKGRTGEVCGVPGDAGTDYFGPPTPSSTNQTVTRGSTLPAVTITPTKTTGTSIKDDDAAIGDELVAQIAAGKLPAPTYDDQGYPNTLYFVFFPSTVRINLQGMQSCIKFAGYHFSASYDAQVSCKGKYIPYAVIPDCGLPTNYMAATISHELAEAVSDSDVGPTNPNPLHQSDGAWYLGPSYPCSDIESCPSNCGEIGDVCQSTGSAMIPGTAITAQNMWSQTKNDCVVSNPTVGPKPGPAGPPATSCSPGQHDAGAPDAGSKDGGASSSSSSSGSTSGSSSSSGSSSGSSGTSGSSGGSSGDAGASSGDGAGGDDGGGGTTGCGVVQSGERVGAGTLAALLAMALLGRARRRSKG